MSIGERIKIKRKEKKLTQAELGKLVSASSQVISNWERGYTQPSSDDIKRLSIALDTQSDYLLGTSNTPAQSTKNELPELTAKDERDIKKKLQEMIDNLNGKDGYAAYDGKTLDDLDEEDRELLIASLENSMRIAKKIAKQKFTNKRYRKDEN